jgi:hypothetical protein
MAHSDGRKDQSLDAVAVVEQWLDSQASWQELRKARSYCWISPPESAWAAAEGAASNDALSASVDAATRFSYPTTPADIRQWEAACQAGVVRARTTQSDLLRCIIGNPFRPVSIDPSWLTPTVTSLAAAAYDERSLPSGELEKARLGVLADALEDAGCTDASILDHLRSPGPHVRGCFAVDILLGKE